MCAEVNIKYSLPQTILLIFNNKKKEHKNKINKNKLVKDIL